MRINTNVSALNTQRILSQTNTAVARSIGRLSSGFRINRAADDAAGLGIANQMRADLRAMNQASRNAEQASSALQIAEGAAQTISTIVDRMKELAVQAASDNTSDEGRLKIQAEFKQLQDEITRIVTTTKFQGKTLLDGSWGQRVENADTLEALGATISLNGALEGSYTLTATAGTGGAGDTVTLSDGTNNQTITLTAGTLGNAQSLNFDQLGIQISVTGLTDGANHTFDVSGTPVTFMVSVSGNEGSNGAAGADEIELGTLDLSLETLGLDAHALNTKAGAQSAIASIDAAISKISDAFGEIGAAQNRLDYALTNVRTAIENVSAAESTIRDADMAAEMTEFTRNQILQQAGTAMLAQANAAPQLVLRLLQ